MFASAIVVFREVLEAALVVGIVMAATHGLPRRNFWILAGIGAGIAGALLIAGFADVIAAAAAGMGQEFLNASVLFIAVAVLGWSIVWMRRHGRELSQQAKSVGRNVAAGEIPIHMLAVVVGLAVLREGAEVVLFLYGIAASSGDSGTTLLVGGLIGVVAGVAVGYLIYRGLVRIAAKHLFSVTSWLLAFLAAGMASQGAGDLVSAGVLPPLVARAWDTSSILSERNIFGQVLHTLFGYDSHPALIQVFFYLATLGLIAMLMRRADGAAASNRRLPPAAGVAAAALLAALAWPASGHAENKVYSPIVHYGEYSIEARGNTAVDPGSHATDELDNQKYELEYGATEHWQTALVGEFNRDAGESLHYHVTGWENIYQLFDQGEAWIDSAIYLEYEVSNEKDGADGIEGKLLLEKQLGNFVTTANLIFEKQIGSHAEDGTTFGYATRIKYRWKPYLEPGIEAYGDVGPINNNTPIDEQTHRIGPAIMGMLPIARALNFNYELGWLIGLTQGAPRSSLRWLGELEYHF